MLLLLCIIWNTPLQLKTSSLGVQLCSSVRGWPTMNVNATQVPGDPVPQHLAYNLYETVLNRFVFRLKRIQNTRIIISYKKQPAVSSTIMNHRPRYQHRHGAPKSADTLAELVTRSWQHWRRGEQPVQHKRQNTRNMCTSFPVSPYRSKEDLLSIRISVNACTLTSVANRVKTTFIFTRHQRLSRLQPTVCQ